MTHGDKAKAKAAKSSKASARKTSGKTGENGKTGKGSIKETGKTVAAKGKKGAPEKSATSSKKSGGAAKNVSPAETRARGRGTVPEDVTFTNPTVADAFKRAVKKYPAAFRRLTD